MTDLAKIAIGLGGLLILLSLPLLLLPQWAAARLREFPRSVWPGRVLAAIGVAWASYEVMIMPLGWFDSNAVILGQLVPYKWSLYIAGPVLYFLIIRFMDELLAPRALGGLLLLVGSPVLEAIRWHSSKLRLVVVLLVYLWVIAGMILMLSPFRFRKALSFWIESDVRRRLLGNLGLALGLAMVAMGLKIM